jgi:thioredoxin 1
MKVLTSLELKEKIQNGESFIVDMYADWCGPCKVLGPIVERFSNKLQQENSLVNVYKFDIESDKEFAMSLGVRSIPTIKSFKNGELVTNRVGVIQENDLMGMANELI